MNETIAELLALVELDKKIDELQQERDKLPRRLSEKKAQIDLILKKGEELAKTRLTAQLERDKLNLELEEEQERIRHYDKRVKEIKNNREYQSLMRELNFAKRVASEAETEILKRMETIEQTEAGIAEAKTEQEKAQGELATIDVDVREGTEKFDADLQTCKGQRTGIMGKIPANIRAHYDMVRRRSADALATAVNYRCTGCNMSVPPQLYNRLLRMSDFISCPSCQRILYVETAKV